MAAKRPSPSNRPWTWPEIRNALTEKGYSLTRLASESGVSKPAVTKVKKVASRRIQAVIAKKVGVPAHEIWPDRYSIAETALRRARS